MSVLSNVLIIEDDEDIFKIVEKSLEGLFSVDHAETSEVGRTLLKSKKYEIVIVDLYLEDEYGIKLIKEFNTENLLEGKKVFILTGEHAVSQEIEGHRIGVDEYIKKPINPQVFRAIVEKNAMKLKGKNEDELKIGALNISLSALKVTLGDQELEEEVDLTGKEFKILVNLVKNQGLVMSREKLYESIWDKESDSLQRTLDMHVSTLRKKLGAYGKHIKTIRSIGYKFEV
ncbi:MAG: response regulator transcription factor [Bacteriovoracaceae bacterium]|nr:response regulator transcription factor [Bacteriovoracaceae bacterium]